MKSLHVPFGFYPDAVGGTEVYVAMLAAALASRNHPAAVAAPASTATQYLHDGIPIYRFAISDRVADASELYDEGDLNAAEGFARILDRERPDIVHLHAFTRACSVRLVRKARACAIPVVFTYHTPTVSCARGTLLEFGAKPCDGRIDVSRCAACTLQGLGVDSLLSRALGLTPIAIGKLLESARCSGGAWTALRMTSLIDRRHQAILELFSLVDGIVALTPWVRGVLLTNGVPDSKIFASPHGIPRTHISAVRSRARMGARLRVAHLGRLDPVKGTSILIRALRQIPEAAIDLDIFGIVQGGANAAVRTELQRLAEGDPRVTFRHSLEHSAVVDTLADYDLVAVPSQGLETGPLVVLEAFAAGVPVLGSALGGLLDKVTDEIDGLLVRQYDAVDSWAKTLERCAAHRPLIDHLRRGVRPPRSMHDVASDMEVLSGRLTPGRLSGGQSRLEPSSGKPERVAG